MSARSPSPPEPRRSATWNAIDERFHLSGLVAFLSHKEVPVSAHSIVWYYLGGLSLFLFVVQIGTGILLLMNYQVGENTSYESMKILVGPRAVRLAHPLDPLLVGAPHEPRRPRSTCSASCS